MEQVKERMSVVGHKVLVLSGKGGVGKSTFSCQLAWLLADMQLQVGTVDRGRVAGIFRLSLEWLVLVALFRRWESWTSTSAGPVFRG
jgi:hypothetical protein